MGVRVMRAKLCVCCLGAIIKLFVSCVLYKLCERASYELFDNVRL